ncbi:hypothetical protein [Pseudoalteromonas prydzensis]|uniref:hypothetical protein n=1 Tax=Pseudoalteromonas prydzensis TaxID=182141 RepID=UPI003FD2FCF4
MNHLKIYMLMAVVAATSSAITYYLSKPLGLVIQEPEKLELAISKGLVKDYCAKYLFMDIRKKSDATGEVAQVKIKNIDGFGVSIVEMYCVANVDVLRSKSDTDVITRTDETYYYGLSKNRGLTFNVLTKKDIESAFEHYAECNKS